MVLRAGLEPARPIGHQVLNLARLPIPPPEQGEGDHSPQILEGRSKKGLFPRFASFRFLIFNKPKSLDQYIMPQF